MGILPYWDRDMDIDIVSWASYALDFHPVSINALHSKELGNIAAFSLEIGSELLYMRSSSMGRAGALFPESIIDPERYREHALGFLMLFGFSKKMEELTALLLETIDEVQAGITLCGIWDRYFLKDEVKVIAFMGKDPFFNEIPFLDLLSKTLHDATKGLAQKAFFAEQFGYRRATIPYETDDVVELEISQLLFDFEMQETREIVGPPPQIRPDMRMSLAEALMSLEQA